MVLTVGLMHGPWALGAPGSPKTSPDPDRLRDKTCARQNEELAQVAGMRAPAYLKYGRVLRQKVLENPGRQHREHARRALIKLLLLRAKQAGPVGPCVKGAEPLGPDESARVARWYALAEGGPAGVVELRAALQSDEQPDRLVRSMVAAHSLSLSGILPSSAMIEELRVLVLGERDPVVRLELALALAAYAQRTKDAFVVFRHWLMTEADCGFAEAVAFNLPGEDLRYRLFHGLAKESSARGRNLRKWIRAGTYEGCRKD